MNLKRNSSIPILHHREMKFKDEVPATVTGARKGWGRGLRPWRSDSEASFHSFLLPPCHCLSLFYCDGGHRGDREEYGVG